MFFQQTSQLRCCASLNFSSNPFGPASSGLPTASSMHSSSVACPSTFLSIDVMRTEKDISMIDAYFCRRTARAPP